MSDSDSIKIVQSRMSHSHLQPQSSMIETHRALATFDGVQVKVTVNGCTIILTESETRLWLAQHAEWYEQLKAQE